MGCEGGLRDEVWVLGGRGLRVGGRRMGEMYRWEFGHDTQFLLMYNVDARGLVISAFSQRFPCPSIPECPKQKGISFLHTIKTPTGLLFVRPVYLPPAHLAPLISFPPVQLEPSPPLNQNPQPRQTEPNAKIKAPPTKTPHPRYSPPRDTDSSDSPSDTPPAPPARTPPTAPSSPSRSPPDPPRAAQTPRCPRARQSPARPCGIARRGGCCRWRVPRRFARGRRCVCGGGLVLGSGREGLGAGG